MLTLPFEVWICRKDIFPDRGIIEIELDGCDARGMDKCPLDDEPCDAREAIIQWKEAV